MALRMETFFTEMSDLLCQACTRDALSCIRAVDDMYGLTAWHLLHKQYNTTMARAIVGAVTHLAKVKELKHVEAALQKWEEQLKVQKHEKRAVFSETGRAGIVMAMMSESIQKFVYSSLGIAVG